MLSVTVLQNQLKRNKVWHQRNFFIHSSTAKESHKLHEISLSTEWHIELCHTACTRPCTTYEQTLGGRLVIEKLLPKDGQEIRF